MKYLLITFILFKITFGKILDADIRSSCKEYTIFYPHGIKYSLRFKKYFPIYKCDLLMLYSFLDSTNKEYILDYIDEYPNIIYPLIVLVKKYPNFLKKLLTTDNFPIFLEEAQANQIFFKNILYLLQRISVISSDDFSKIKVIYFAAYQASTGEEAYKNYIQLKNIPYKFLDALIISYLALKKQFPNLKKSDFIRDFINLKYKLSYSEMETLIQYSPIYLISFLYNVKYVDNFAEYQQELIFVYKLLHSKYKEDPRLALYLTFHLSPFLITQHIEFTPTFEKVISDLIETEILETLVIPNNITIPDFCKSRTNYLPLLGEGALKRLLFLAGQEKKIYHQFINEINSEKNRKQKLLSIIALLQIAERYYSYSNSPKWEMVKGILQTSLLKGKMLLRDKVFSIILPLEKINYFQTLESKSDWNNYVKPEDEEVTKGAPKYLFILFTPVGDKDTSPFLLQELYSDPSKAKKDLNRLANYSIEELETHRFTFFEKASYLAEKGIEILSYIPVFIEFKGVTTAIKVGIKAVGKFGTKFVFKKTIKNSSYFLRKIGLEEVKKTIFSLNRKYNLATRIERFEERLDNIETGMRIGKKAFYLFFPALHKFKQVCEEGNK